jgi:hypothetical protein
MEAVRVALIQTQKFEVVYFKTAIMRTLLWRILVQ